MVLSSASADTPTWKFGLIAASGSPFLTEQQKSDP